MRMRRVVLLLRRRVPGVWRRALRSQHGALPAVPAAGLDPRAAAGADDGR